jgi:hypothetical protein
MRAFGRPRGTLGRLGGIVMARTNRKTATWAIARLKRPPLILGPITPSPSAVRRDLGLLGEFGLIRRPGELRNQPGVSARSV